MDFVLFALQLFFQVESPADAIPIGSCKVDVEAVKGRDNTFKLLASEVGARDMCLSANSPGKEKDGSFWSIGGT